MTDSVFHRVVPEASLDAVRPGGGFDALIQRRGEVPAPVLDMQLRRDRRGAQAEAQC